MKQYLAGTSLAAAMLVVATGCGSSGSSSSSSTASVASDAAPKACKAAIGIMAPVTGDAAQQGTEQVNFAKLAVQQFNQKNKTNFTTVDGDTQLDPGQASTVAQQFVSNDAILGIVGPAGSQEVAAIGPVLQRVKLAAVSASATSGDLTTSGKYPTFSRVVPSDAEQGPTDAEYISGTLGAKKVFVVDDQTSYSTGIASSLTDKLKAAGVTVTRESVGQKSTDFSSLVSKISADTDVVFLPWQLAANAQLFGKQMAEQKKTAKLFGSDGLFSPKDFNIEGAYVSSFAPDINSIPEDKPIADAFQKQYGEFGTFGPPTYAAATVVATAIKAACDAGGASRQSVNDQIRKVSLPTSILGQPIAFSPQGDLKGAKFFIFQVKNKKFELIK
jgi:branched-chain amino acid transport system substrate-binding protein